MENIYSYQWKGKRTGWDYKVVFVRSSTEELGETTEVKLPRGSFKLQKTKWAFDKYRLGMHSAKTLSAELKMNLLNGSAYDEFVDMIYDPLTEIEKTIFGETFNYLAGTKIELWVKFNYNAEESVNIWRLHYEGMIREDQEQKQATKDNVYNLEFEDLFKCAFDSGTMKKIRSVNTVDDAERIGYIDYYDNTNKRVILQMPGVSQTILFQPFTVIETYISTVTQTILRDLKRNQGYEFDVKLPVPHLYRQTYNGSCLRGAALSKEDLYVASVIYYDVSPVAGLVINDDEVSLPQKYQSIWDFLVDYYESNFRIQDYIPGELASLPLHSFNSIITLNPKKYDLDITRQSMLLKSVTASLIEIKDGNVSDIDKKIADKAGSRNANEFTIPVIFNNMPSQGDFIFLNSREFQVNYSSYAGEWALHDLGLEYETGKTWIGLNPRNMGLYYKDIPEFVTNENGEFFRVHEYAVYQLMSGFYSENIIGFNAIDMSADELQYPNVTIAKFQNDSSIPKILSETMFKALSDRTQKKIKLSTLTNSQTKFSLGGDVGFFWDDPTTAYIIDLSIIDARETDDGKYWLPLNCEIDYEEEKAELELLMETL